MEAGRENLSIHVISIIVYVLSTIMLISPWSVVEKTGNYYYPVIYLILCQITRSQNV